MQLLDFSLSIVKVWLILGKRVSFQQQKKKQNEFNLNLKLILPFLPLTDRSEEHIERIEKYLTAIRMMRNYDDNLQDPIFSEVVTLDLGTVVSSVSGPKRPQDRVSVSEMKADFQSCLTSKVNTKNFPILKLLKKNWILRDFTGNAKVYNKIEPKVLS